MSAIYLPTIALDDRFPLTLGTLYVYKSTRKVKWMLRRGKMLWVNVDEFNQWAELGGKQFRLPVDHPLAVELKEGELAH